MDPGKLIKEELIYELRVRGFEDIRGETAASMRKKLSEVLANDAFGQLIVSDTFQPAPLEEIKIILSKIEWLENLIATKPIVEGGDIVIQINTKVKHLTGRLQRLTIEDTEENKPSLRAVDNLFERLDKIEELTDRKILDNKCQVLAGVSSVGTSVSQPSTSNYETPTSVAPQVINNIYKSHSDPRKWGIVFSGDGTSSISAFLEQVEERRRASHIAETDLLTSMVDLLQGNALIFFRSIRDEVSSWNDFRCRFKEEFQPFDYEEELMQEIRNRRQGSEESIGIYFACMKRLFSRLTVELGEKEKVTILRRNLYPYFIHNLGLAEYSSVEELLKLCKRLEINRLTAERSHPSLSGSLLEPDLSRPIASVSDSVRKHKIISKLDAVEEPQCWNCLRTGHRFRNCGSPRRHMFCFGCGTADIIKKDCSRCYGNISGNDTGDATAGQRRQGSPSR